MRKNLLISSVFFVSLYALAEVTFLYWFPRFFPADFVMAMTDEALHPLLQSSKKSIYPEHYIALVGDSYAAGMGDWATQEMHKPMARYGVAHLLQDKTGRDVVSFGSAGAGSVRGIVTEPFAQIAYLKKFFNKKFPAPDHIFILFYEGNDLYDNAAYFHYSFPKLFNINKQYDQVTYQQYLQKFAIDRDKTMQWVRHNDWLRYWPFTALLNKVFRAVAGLPARADTATSAYDASLDPPWIFGGASYQEPGKINKALIATQPQQLPDKLQGPALALNEEEWTQSWFAFEQSLVFLKRAFPHSGITLVYVPSVLSVYDVQSNQVSVQTYDRRESIYPREQMEKQAQKMRAKFQEIATQQHLPVIDVTDDMRAAAKQHALHGPKDWNHPNELGYRVMANSMLSRLVLGGN